MASVREVAKACGVSKTAVFNAIGDMGLLDVDTSKNDRGELEVGQRSASALADRFARKAKGSDSGAPSKGAPDGWAAAREAHREAMDAMRAALAASEARAAAAERQLAEKDAQIARLQDQVDRLSTPRSWLERVFGRALPAPRG